jgi:hypothetical protein
MSSVWNAFQSPQNDPAKPQKEETISVERAPVELETAAPMIENEVSLNTFARQKREESESNWIEEGEDAGFGVSV